MKNYGKYGAVMRIIHRDNLRNIDTIVEHQKSCFDTANKITGIGLR